VTIRDMLLLFEDAQSDFLDECEMRHMTTGNIDAHVSHSGRKGGALFPAGGRWRQEPVRRNRAGRVYFWAVLS